MVKMMNIHDLRGRRSFGETYRACVEENRVRPDRSPFYVIWAKDFAHFLPEKALKDSSRKDIETFLADLGKRQGIGAGIIGTRQCRDHHDLYPRTEQARAFSEEPGGYLKKVKSNDIGVGKHYQKRMDASRYLKGCVC